MAERLRYEEPVPITEQDLRREMASGDPQRQYAALVRASLSIPDSPVLLSHVTEQLERNELPLVEAALTAASHIARLGRFERPKEITARITPLKKDPRVGEFARAILWDVQLYCEMGLWRRLKRWVVG
jgi:hypothetical protein